MKWKKRERELAALRAKHAGSKLALPFPDLSVDQRTAECSNKIERVGPMAPKAPRCGRSLIVDHLHKSSLQVLLPDEIPWAGGRKP